MIDQIMTSFVPLPGQGDNPAGVATYSYCGRSIQRVEASYSQARVMENWIGHVVGNARRQQRDELAVKLRDKQTPPLEPRSHEATITTSRCELQGTGNRGGASACGAD